MSKIDFKEEEFKDIENYEGEYQVSNYGRVFSVKRGKFLSYSSNAKGYRLVHLYKNNKQKTYSVHRLVAQAFIPNPSNLPEVNHKSEDKTDNRFDNLEWMSHKENCNYGSRTARILSKTLAHPNCVIKQPKVVLQFTREEEFVKEYPSLIEAERQTKIHYQSIAQCCLGKLHSAGKYLWRFKDVS